MRVLGRTILPAVTVTISVVLAALAGAASARAATYSDAVASTPGVVSYWPMTATSGTTAADVNGVNPGSYQNASGYQLGAAGLLASDSAPAVTFDGDTGQLYVPDSTSLHPSSQLSVEAW